jgi:alpha-N-arabinofuranosidase
MQKQFADAGQPNLHIAFTEWLFYCCRANDASAPAFTNMGGAVAAGGFFNMLLRNATIVPISDMTGIIEFAGIWKKRSQVFATPAYYAFKMFSTANPDTALQVETSSPTYGVHGGVSRFPEIAAVPYLDVAAVRNEKRGVVSIFCVNRNLREDLSAEITLDELPATGMVDVSELFAPSIYETNDEMHPAHIRPSDSSIEVKGSLIKFVFRHASITRIDLKMK